jgi:hypothetical protein
LVVPRFDESDSDSSSESDAGHAFPDSKSHNDDEDNNVGSTEEGIIAGTDQTFNGEFKWDAVDDIQHLTNENLQMKAQVVEYKKQIQEYVSLSLLSPLFFYFTKTPHLIFLLSMSSLQIQLEALDPIPGLNPSSVQELLLQGKDGTVLMEHVGILVFFFKIPNILIQLMIIV